MLKRIKMVDPVGGPIFQGQGDYTLFTSHATWGDFYGKHRRSKWFSRKHEIESGNVS